MLTVSTKKLIAAIEEAEAFRLPDLSVGADYIYNNLYKKLSHGEELRLSAIDWASFNLDDVDTVRELHFDVLTANESKAYTITGALRGIKPASTAAAYV